MTPQQRLRKLAAAMRGKNTSPTTGMPPAAGPSNGPNTQNMSVANPRAALRPPTPPAPPIPEVPGPNNAPMTTPKQPSIKTDVQGAGSTKMSQAKVNKVRDMLGGKDLEAPSVEPVKPPKPKKSFKPTKPGDFKSFRSGATSGNI